MFYPHYMLHAEIEISRLKPMICWALPSHGLWHGAGVRYIGQGPRPRFPKMGVPNSWMMNDA